MKQSNEMAKEFSVIVLAAGKSERMGFPKLALKYDEHSTFIEHIVKEYHQFGCKEIVIVVNEISHNYLIDHHISFQSKVKIIINEHPDWHRFYSLKIGAKSFSKPTSSFVHNVDNPFVNQVVLKNIIKASISADYVSPEYEERGGHPFFISKKVIQEIQATESNQIHLKEFLNQYRRIRITVTDEKVLANINTLEEYNNYIKK